MANSRPRKRRVGSDEPRPPGRVTPPGTAWDDEPAYRRRNQTMLRAVVWVVVIAFVLPLFVGALLALMT